MAGPFAAPAAEAVNRRLKRSYGTATVAEETDSFALRLDDRAALTPAGRPIIVPTASLAEAIAEEWNMQEDVVDFAAMPMTRLAMTAINLQGSDQRKWRDALRSYLKSDLLCYRAENPAALAERERAAWDPLLEWAARLGVALRTGVGIGAVDQSAEAIVAGDRVFARASAFVLLGMKEAAEASGSAVIALALAEGAFAPAMLFDASRVDEAFQAERWGRDEEAAAREARLRRDFMEIARFLALLRS